MDGFEELFERARAGDAEARGRLLEEHLGGLRAFVRLKSGKLLRAKESQSDLVQSACREALSDLSSFECTGEEHFRAWLYRIALHKVMKRAEYHTAGKRDAAREVDVAPRPGDRSGDDQALLEAYGAIASPSSDAVAREEIERIEGAFDALAESDREVLVHVLLEGQSHAEIARRSGKSREAVRQTFSRARARLAMRLDALRQG